MSRVGVFQAAVQCPTAENSFGGMFLRGHTFKTSKVGWPAGCYLMSEEVTCQSYNFVIGHKVCELNNRTKEARPEDFRLAGSDKVLHEKGKNRGTLPLSLLACLSHFSNAAIFNASVRSARNFERGLRILRSGRRNHQEKRWDVCVRGFGAMDVTKL